MPTQDQINEWSVSAGAATGHYLSQQPWLMVLVLLAIVAACAWLVRTVRRGRADGRRAREHAASAHSQEPS